MTKPVAEVTAQEEKEPMGPSSQLSILGKDDDWVVWVHLPGQCPTSPCADSLVIGSGATREEATAAAVVELRALAASLRADSPSVTAREGGWQLSEEAKKGLALLRDLVGEHLHHALDSDANACPRCYANYRWHYEQKASRAAVRAFLEAVPPVEDRPK